MTADRQDFERRTSKREQMQRNTLRDEDQLHREEEQLEPPMIYIERIQEAVMVLILLAAIDPGLRMPVVGPLIAEMAIAGAALKTIDRSIKRK